MRREPNNRARQRAGVSGVLELAPYGEEVPDVECEGEECAQHHQTDRDQHGGRLGGQRRLVEIEVDGLQGAARFGIGAGTFSRDAPALDAVLILRAVVILGAGVPGLAAPVLALALAALLAASDLHIYLTVPFVLSWSMMDAMSCGAVVLGSATAPVMEMIQDGQNGLLADFFSPEQFAERAISVLKDPDAARPLGKAESFVHYTDITRSVSAALAGIPTVPPA